MISNCLPQRSVSIHSQYPLPQPEALSQFWPVLRHVIPVRENNLVYGGNKIALQRNLSSYIWLQSGPSFIDHDESHLAWNLPAKRFTTFETMVPRRLSMIVLETKRRTHDARNEFENTNGHEFTKAFLGNGATYAVRYWKIQQAMRSFPW